ncbi:MAG: hypothetical protein ABI852_10975 [Gemmatimonadaceae bacterium]
MPNQSRNSRDGRALVECIVAIFLLSVTALSMAATVRGTLALADDAALVTRAQSLATTRVEDALTVSCATGASGTDHAPRIDALWVQSGSPRSSQLHLDLTLQRSPIAFAGSASMLFGIEAGGVCP